MERGSWVTGTSTRTAPAYDPDAEGAGNGKEIGTESEGRPAHLGIEIRSLSNMINRYLGVTMPEDARNATGGNARIIMFLAKNQTRNIFQYDIEERFSITRSTASRVLSLMEKKGLIERHAVERDARLRKIVLTKAALDIADSLRANAMRMEDMLFEGFQQEDRDNLSRYFARMRSNLLSTGLVGSNCPGAPNQEGRDTQGTTGDSGESEDEKKGTNR